MLHMLCMGLWAALVTSSVAIIWQLNSCFAARIPAHAVPAVQDTQLPCIGEQGSIHQLQRSAMLRSSCTLFLAGTLTTAPMSCSSEG